MKGLILKDMLCIRRYLTYMLFLTLIFCALAVSSNNLSIISGLGPALSMILILSVFTYDEQNHWTAFALSLPINRKEFVIARYLFALFTSIAIILFSLVLTFVLNSIFHSIALEELISMAVGGFFAALLLIALSAPAAYKFGVEKGRYVLVIFFLAFMLILVTFGDMIANITLPAISGMLLAIIFIGIALIIYSISIVLSIHIMNQKEL